MSESASGVAVVIDQHLADAPASIQAGLPRPLSEARQRVAMNAMTHGLTGQNLFLTAHEFSAYLKLGAGYFAEIRPVGIREMQTTQKIIDTNWRLNRIAALENNLINSALLASLRPAAGKGARTSDDKLEGMVAQSDGFRADCNGPNSFEKLGRYEARLSRLLFKNTEEVERLQAIRIRKAGNHDSFVLEECEAWVWYSQMLAALTEITPDPATPSLRNPFGKKTFSSAVGSVVPMADRNVAAAEPGPTGGESATGAGAESAQSSPPPQSPKTFAA